MVWVMLVVRCDGESGVLDQVEKLASDVKQFPRVSENVVCYDVYRPLIARFSYRGELAS